MANEVHITVNLTEAEVNRLLIEAAVKKANKSKGFNISDAILTKRQFKNGNVDEYCLYTSIDITLKV